MELIKIWEKHKNADSRHTLTWVVFPYHSSIDTKHPKMRFYYSLGTL